MNSSATPLLVASIAMTLGTAPIVQADEQPSPNPNLPTANQPTANQPEIAAPAWVIDLRADIVNQPPIGQSTTGDPIAPPLRPAQPAAPPAPIAPSAQPFPKGIVPPDVGSPVNGAPPDENRPTPSPDLEATAGPSSMMIAVTQPLPADWWHQGAQSPIAIAIGNAEGTRTPDGSKNEAYYWHRDPGNGADNFGTFSYQHLSDREQTPVDRQPSSDQKRHQAAIQGLPETADSRQLTKLQSFYQQLLAQAHLRGVALTELEILNGLDLANQSETAALDSWGYIDRLIQAKSRTAAPQEQIDQARTWSYWNPKSNRWDAPGLGNQYESIRHDQQRRSEAVTVAFARQQGQMLLAQSGNLLSFTQSYTVTAAEHRQAIEQLTSSILRFETDRVN